MVPSRILLLGVALWMLTPPGRAEASVTAQDQRPQPSGPPIKTVNISGLQELDEASILDAADVRVGDPLLKPADEIAADVERKYREEGFAFAEVAATFDEASGTLALTIDEGRIDEVEFTGVGVDRARTLTEEFAMRAGDVFNRSRAADALRALLRPSRGALEPARRAFDLVRRNGRRVLVVDVTERAGAFRATVDMGEREDWFTPVDGLVPSLGFAGAVFDQKNFNHAYVAAHVSIGTATGNAGYAIGFERPLFRPVRVFVGGELYDLTATDDRWQMSGTQASLAAITVRDSVRDYYRRRGVQLHAAVQPTAHYEIQFAWRGERHEDLAVTTDFSLWNGDDEFRPNQGAARGKMNALVFGGAYDSVGFQDDSLAATYRRHQQDLPFGSSLRHPVAAPGLPVWAVQWTSEISTPGVGSDFDFHRHILSARAAFPLSRYEELRARAIGGWSGGQLLPQRQFSLGGIGSVHGYGFKEAAGTSMLLFNVEYAVGRLNGPHIVPFFDAGRIARASGEAVWMRGVGFGLGLARELRVDFGYKLDDIPGSLQVVLRLGRTF
jgi:outer membrane protein assembly factor BamA